MKVSNTIFAIISMIILLTTCVICQDAEMKVNDVSLKVMGESGKIEITLKKVVEGVEKVDTLNIRFASLTERDSSGNEIGKSGSIKHSFNNFAQIKKEVSKVTQTTFQDISVYTVSLTANGLVAPNSNFIGTFYIFNGSGKINTGGSETVNVSPGSIKFSLDIQDWPFCQEMETCSGVHCCKKEKTMEVGSFLDFELEINGDKSIENVKKNDFKFGTDTQLILSSMISIDDQWKQMSDGYPKVSTQEKTNVFTYRFPLFTKKALYDPVIQQISSGKIQLFLIFTLFIVSLMF